MKTNNILHIKTDRSQSSSSVLELVYGKVVTADCSPARLVLGPATKKVGFTRVPFRKRVFIGGGRNKNRNFRTPFFFESFLVRFLLCSVLG